MVECLNTDCRSLKATGFRQFFSVPSGKAPKMSNYMTFEPKSVTALNYQDIVDFAKGRSVSQARDRCAHAIPRGLSVSTVNLCDILSKAAYLEANLGIKAETITIDIDTLVSSGTSLAPQQSPMLLQ